jgi:hypothetical protein
VDIPSVFGLINAGIQILVREILISGVQQVDQFEIGSICHLVNDSLAVLCHSSIVTTKIGSWANIRAGFP